MAELRKGTHQVGLVCILNHGCTSFDIMFWCMDNVVSPLLEHFARTNTSVSAETHRSMLQHYALRSRGQQQSQHELAGASIVPLLYGVQASVSTWHVADMKRRVTAMCIFDRVCVLVQTYSSGLLQ